MCKVCFSDNNRGLPGQARSRKWIYYDLLFSKRTEKLSEIVINLENREILLKSKIIIVAFSTNNIFRDKSYAIANNIIFGAQLIAAQYRQARVYEATLIPSYDREDYNEKVHAVNRQLI